MLLQNQKELGLSLLRLTIERNKRPAVCMVSPGRECLRCPDCSAWCPSELDLTTCGWMEQLPDFLTPSPEVLSRQSIQMIVLRQHLLLAGPAPVRKLEREKEELIHTAHSTQHTAQSLSVRAVGSSAWPLSHLVYARLRVPCLVCGHLFPFVSSHHFIKIEL